MVQLSMDLRNGSIELAEEIKEKCEQAMELLAEGDIEEVFIPYDGSGEVREAYKRYAQDIEAFVRFGSLGQHKWKHVVWFSIPSRRPWRNTNLYKNSK